MGLLERGAAAHPKSKWLWPFVNHLASTLKEFKVPKPEHEELMAKIRKLKPYIVETKAKD